MKTSISGFRYWWLFLCAGLVFISGCHGGGSGPDTSAPAGLSYSVDNLVFPTGAPIDNLVPSYSGTGLTEFSVSPDLPVGLVLDPQSGVISGTPSAVSPKTTYTVTGTYAQGSISTGIDLEVVQAVQPPVSLQYSDSAPVYKLGQQITPDVASYEGGQATQFTIAPALPAGLQIDPATGEITGAPTAAAAAAQYVVTAGNSAGSITATLTIAVEAGLQPPANLQYGDASPVYIKGFVIDSNRPTWTGGNPDVFSVSPSLPPGLSMDTKNGVISGIPEAAQAGTDYTVTAANEAGPSQQTLRISILTESGDLPAPTFPDALSTGYLVAATTRNGIRADIAPYAGIAVGDEVTLYWMAYSTLDASSGSEIDGSSYSTTLTVNADTMANGLEFVVPVTYAEGIANIANNFTGAGKIIYSVKRGTTVTTSSSTIVKVDLYPTQN